MIAVRRKRGCSRIIVASSNPSRSGMHTSRSTSGEVGLEQVFERLTGRVGHDQVGIEPVQNRRIAQEFRRLVVDDQDVRVFHRRAVCARVYGLDMIVLDFAYRCSHIRSADSSCSVFTGFAR